MRTLHVLFGVLAVALSLVLAGAGAAQAHPYDAPQLGDVQNFNYGTSPCPDSTPFTSGTYFGEEPGVIALQRLGEDGYWRTVMDDGVYSTVGETESSARGWVALKYGDVFQIVHRVPQNDVGEYRVVSANGTAAVLTDLAELGVLAGWDSWSPSPEACYEMDAAI